MHAKFQECGYLILLLLFHGLLLDLLFLLLFLHGLILDLFLDLCLSGCPLLLLPLPALPLLPGRALLLRLLPPAAPERVGDVAKELRGRGRDAERAHRDHEEFLQGANPVTHNLRSGK